MLINKSMISGMVALIFGIFAILAVTRNHMAHEKGLPYIIIGLVLLIIGAYLIAKGKRQQLNERNNQGN